jgi:hypothetical protein
MLIRRIKLSVEKGGWDFRAVGTISFSHWNSSRKPDGFDLFYSVQSFLARFLKITVHYSFFKTQHYEYETNYCLRSSRCSGRYADGA